MILEMHDEILKLAAVIEAEGLWESDIEMFQLLREFVTIVRVAVYTSEHELVVISGLRKKLEMVEQRITELEEQKPHAPSLVSM